MAMTTRRRILKEFRIGEISAVDCPAQVHAKMTLMKSKTKELDMQVEKTTRGKPQAFASFEAAVAHLRKEHGLSGTGAMSMAAREHPELLKRYNEEGWQRLGKAMADAAKARDKPKEVADFELRAEAIAQRDGVSRTVAMERARRENPKMFRAYQQA